MSLSTAFKFAALYSAIAFAVKVVREQGWTQGLLPLSFISGLNPKRVTKGLRGPRPLPTFQPMSDRLISLPPVTVDWGRTRYIDAWRRQEEFVGRRIADEIGDTLIFTEHDPVFTLGLRSGAEANLVWDEARRARENVEVVKTNRGGDITYHGPGQIVGYPIVSLAARRDLHAYLRFLEQVLIDSLCAFGVTATRREGLTGIWVGRGKIAAIGVAVRRWVTYHGFALNVNARLDHFSGIIPCGIAATDGTVTSIQADLGPELDLAKVKRVLAAEFSAQLPRLLAPGACAHRMLPPAPTGT